MSKIIQKKSVIIMILLFSNLLLSSCKTNEAEKVIITVPVEIPVTVTQVVEQETKIPETPTLTITNTPPPPTETKIPTSTVTPSIPKVLLYLSAKNDYLSKLRGIALESRIKIEDLDDMDEDSHYQGVIAFTGWSYSGGTGVSRNNTLDGDGLLAIRKFVKTGGRAVIFITWQYSSDLNSTLGDLFLLTITREHIREDETVIIDGGDLLPLWNGLKIGASKPAKYDPIIVLRTYLSGDTSQGDIVYITSDETNKQRVASTTMNIGEGQLILVQYTCEYNGDCEPYGGYFHDTQIDNLDNEEAASILLNWLVSED